jgi:hypothetical protein
MKGDFYTFFGGEILLWSFFYIENKCFLSDFLFSLKFLFFLFSVLRFFSFLDINLPFQYVRLF